jgi:8-amino-7-oxononanoate synthase
MSSARPLDPFRDALDALNSQHRLRTLTPSQGIDFTSNDYLGLAGAPRLTQALMAALERGISIGAGGSRLLRGNARAHEDLEDAAAEFFGSERTLFFSSGYLANYALFATLPQSGDLIAHDEFIHASVHDGMRASRASHVRFRHNDMNALAQCLSDWRSSGGRGRIWIAAESLYSMDGDRAPLADLIALASQHDALLVIDEAHATGVLGPDGRGLSAAFVDHANLIALHTCSKAMGAAGALVCAPRVLCEFLINRCRPFIYSTAPSPLMAVAALEAMAIFKEEPQRRERLERLVSHASTQAARGGVVSASSSHIVPVIIGSDARALRIAENLRQHGFDVRAVRPPTVPMGTARLRISITLNADEDGIEALFFTLAEQLSLAA